MNSKIALVTGGNRGLGQNTVLHLARRGVDSILTYRSHSAEAETVVDEAERLGAHAVALPLDVADHSTFADFAARVEMLLQRALATRTVRFPGEQRRNRCSRRFHRHHRNPVRPALERPLQGVFF